jgi:CheY-like chemotaxis protein
VNLALNGRDAMPDGGAFTIQTRNATPSQEHRPTMGDGRYVTMQIRDTGAGMTPYVKQHVFEPFFTTKAVGEGTGLGLSAVYGIVKQLNGFVWVESDVGHGSTFHVYLPAVVERHAQESLPTEPETKAPPGSGPTILLVEDEDAVRRFTKRALELYGYRVLDAATPEEALSLANGGEALALLLTDVVMPRISGPELAERLKRLQPDLAVLYISGFPSPLLLPDGSIDSAMHLLPKPFTAGQLIRSVQRRLSQDT